MDDRVDWMADQVPLVSGEVEAGPDDDTAPLPVILAQRGSDGPGQASEDRTRRGRPQPASPEPGRPGQDASRMRGPFEPATGPRPRSAAATGPADAAMAASPPTGSAGTPQPKGPAAAPGRPPASASSSPTASKLDQIKDLYLTAEAIGEDALERHFEQVSERQRQLIREYFDQAVKRTADGGTA